MALVLIQVFLVVLSLSILCNQMLMCQGYKILVVVGIPSRSHYNLGKAVADILHDRKHDITFVSPFESTTKTYRELVIPELRDFNMDIPMFRFKDNTLSKLDFIIDANTNMGLLTRAIFSSAQIQKMLESDDENFDLVVVEYFSNDALIGFGVKFDCPVVLVSPLSVPSWLATLTGNPVSLGTVPNVFLPYSNNMNLWQRTVNTMMNVFQDVIGWWIKDPAQKKIYEDFFPEESKKVTYEDLGKKVAATLINSHQSINVARPFLPNAIEVGGYHVEESKPLPKELLDSKDEGVIYFSMGSILKSSIMSRGMQIQVLEAFSKLNQTVLWKYEENLETKPKNVIIRSWMPQSAILAHPNVKMFISHGGLLSCTEAVHHGVPLLVIPIFGDQSHNAAAVVERGNGLTVDFFNLTEISLNWALGEMLNNPKYEENAKKIYDLYHDRPTKPRDLVVFYAEHAIRSGGALHLTPPKLSRSSELLLDVLLVLLMPPFLLFLIVTTMCQKYCFNKTKKNMMKFDNLNKKIK